MTIKVNGHYIELKDSLKLLPFSLKQIGISFKTKHQKLDMEYKGHRYAGCPISQEELKYIANDVLVIKEALEFMFSEGHKKLTIGSCCLDEFKKGTQSETITARCSQTCTKYHLTQKFMVLAQPVNGFTNRIKVAGVIW